MNSIKRKFLTDYARNVSLDDISEKAILTFVNQAKKEREYTFKISSDIENILKDLGLMDDEGILNAALLLFGVNPQKHCPQAVIKCSYFLGQKTSKPIHDHQVYGGTLFNQIKSTFDFVQSKLSRKVGNRQNSPRAEIEFDLPPDAIAEVISNAVVHRDYDSQGSVQVSVFSDRIEIINPGCLPEALSISDLFVKHLSIPVNPFLARPFYLAGFMDQIGTGTLDVIRSFEEKNLPIPDFSELNNQFQVVLYRDPFPVEILRQLEISERQLKGVFHVKEQGSIDNSSYRDLTGVTRKTASRDLSDLVEKGVFYRRGEKRGTHYVLGKRPAPEI
jgi:predicted HTH transcriptional regulator